MTNILRLSFSAQTRCKELDFKSERDVGFRYMDFIVEGISKNLFIDIDS